MSYGKDLRKRVLDFIADGGSKAQAARVYQIHVSTIYIWLKQPADYEPAKTRNCSARKYDRAELARYIQDNPDKLIREIAAHFHVSSCSITHSLKKLGITRKKNRFATLKAKNIKVQDDVI